MRTRAADYDAALLHELQAKDRRVFEYWGHAMSYLPMTDYRYYLPRMQQFAASKSPGIQRRLNKCGHLLQPILERIRQEGPVTSKDFEAPPQEKGGNWQYTSRLRFPPLADRAVKFCGYCHLDSARRPEDRTPSEVETLYFART